MCFRFQGFIQDPIEIDIYIYIYRYIRKILIKIKLLSLRCKNLEKGSKTLNDVEGQFELWVTCNCG